MPWIKRLQLPSLTLGGRICYFLGVIALGLSYKIEQRGVFLLGAVLIGAVVASAIASWLRVRNVVIEVRRPRVARAMEPSPILVGVTSRQSLGGLVIRDRTRPRWMTPVHLDAECSSGGNRSPRNVRTTEIHPRRGDVRVPPLSVFCSRPFGLAHSERIHGEGQEILVLPPLGQLVGPLRLLGQDGRQEKHRSLARRGLGADTLYVRAWAPGDPQRRIHWRATARVGKLMSREFEAERGARLVVAVGGRSRGRRGDRRRMDMAVSLAASLLHQGSRRGQDVLLVAPGVEPVFIPAGNRSALNGAEEVLATLPTVPGWPDWGSLSLTNAVAVLVYPGGPAPKPPAGVEVVNADDAVRRGLYRLWSVQVS